MTLKPGDDALICSARDCTESGVVAIKWANPAIHYGRTKTWLSCQGHLRYLEEYLEYRNFPFEVIAVEELGEGD